MKISQLLVFVVLGQLFASVPAPSVLAQAEKKYDLLIRGGRVIDPRNGIDGPRDVAVAQGRIALVAANIPEADAARVVNATGLVVTPGLIDAHGHVFYGTEPNAYLSNGLSAVQPDAFTFRSGVTTIVDVGGAGWRNFEQFKSQVIDRAATRVLAFVNIVGSGMKGGAIEQNLADMESEPTAACARKYPGTIVGVKVAHYSGPEWDPIDRAVAAGRTAQIPVMIDFGGHKPPLSLEELLMKRLRPGDIFTHMYAHVGGRIPIVDENGKLQPYVTAARQRGLIFDVGHGGGSFLYRQAVPALAQGFKPDIISTDLHTGSMNAGMKDMLNVMSKMLNLGLTLPEVIEQSTWKPAQAIQQPELGHLSQGAPADITVLGVREGKFGFVDTAGFRMPGKLRLECELTVRNGRVVWDLNGLAAKPFVEPRADSPQDVANPLALLPGAVSRVTAAAGLRKVAVPVIW